MLLHRSDLNISANFREGVCGAKASHHTPQALAFRFDGVCLCTTELTIFDAVCSYYFTIVYIFLQFFFNAIFALFLQCVALFCNFSCNFLQYFAIFCNILQYFAIFCNTLQYFAIFCNILQYF